MKKTKLTRSLLAACSIVALSAVMYGCVHSGDDAPAATGVSLEDARAGATYTNETIRPGPALIAAIEAADPADVAAAAGPHPMDAMITLAGLDFKCVTGPCSVTVNDDDTVTIEGSIMVMAHVDSTEPTEPAPPSTADLFATAQGANDDATTAGTKATDAVTTATDAAKLLGVIEAEGESKTVYDSADAILDAQTDTADAVTEAEAAKTAAETAKTAAEALDDTNAHKTSLIAALDAAIKVANAQIEAATDARDGDALKGAVTAVTGGEDADPQKTPGSLAKAVAMMVGEALGGMTVEAAIPRGTLTDPTADDEPVASGDTSAGMTWAMIVGDDNIRRERIGDANTVLMLTSVAGMDAVDVDSEVTSDGGDDRDGKYADVFTSTGSNYKGIGGDVWCLGADCEVTSDGKLKGGWYFTPTSTTLTYIPNPDAAGDASMAYAEETGFAEYGYWLAMFDPDDDAATDNSVLQINRYASLNTDATAVTAGLSYAKADDLPDSATYNGEAVGMSLHKEVDVDNVVTSIESGAFTADVELVLRFGDGDDITLGGMIDNFVGNATDHPMWEVELERKVLPDTGTFADGKTVASGRDGVWSASAYGTAAGERPVGVFGTFNSHFSDGHAAGAYGAN